MLPPVTTPAHRRPAAEPSGRRPGGPGTPRTGSSAGVLAAGVAALLAAACGGEPSPPEPGLECPYPGEGPVTTLRLPAPEDWDDVPVRSTREVLSLGGAAAPDSADPAAVSDVAAGPDGELHVADARAGRVLVFSPTGELLRRVSPPDSVSRGRFGGALRLAVGPGDTLRVFERQRWRESVFDGRGRLLGTRSFEPRRAPRGAPDVRFDGQGRLYHLAYEGFQAGVEEELGVGIQEALRDSTGRVGRGPVTLDRWSPSDSAWRTLARMHSTRFYVSRDAGLRDAPFAPGPAWATVPGGGVWIADTGEYLLTRLSAGGDTLCRIRVDREPPQVSDEERTAYREASDAVTRSMIQLRDIRRTRSELPVPERRPALDGLHVDGSGDLHVRPAPESWPGRGEELHVIGRDGRPRARVRLPRDVRVLRVTGDAVLGLRGGDGDPVEVVKLDKSGPGGAPGGG